MFHFSFPREYIDAFLSLLVSRFSYHLYWHPLKFYCFSVMTLSSRDDLAIVELVVYTPALLLIIHICIRHGFSPNKAWLFLLLFTLIRLAGASLELATINLSKSITLQTSAALLSSVGLSPLLFSTIGLLISVGISIGKVGHSNIQTKYIRLLRIPIIGALVLIIIGSDASASDLIAHGKYATKTITKIGVIILIAVFAVIVLITMLFMIRRSHAEPGERRLLNAVTASLPFLLIRLIYVILMMFSNIRTFSILYGSLTALGCMALLPEVIVIIIYIGVGMSLPRKVKETRVEAEGWSSRARKRRGWG